jgi:hypothetical protein
MRGFFFVFLNPFDSHKAKLLRPFFNHYLEEVISFVIAVIIVLMKYQFYIYVLLFSSCAIENQDENVVQKTKDSLIQVQQNKLDSLEAVIHIEEEKQKVTTDSKPEQKANQPSRIETEKWILNKLNQYSYSDSELFPGEKIEFSIENGEIIIMSKYRHADGAIWFSRLPIKKINSIRFEVLNNRVLHLIVYCKCSKNYHKYDEDDIRPSEMNTDRLIILDSDFNKNNLPDRMEKALKHLIKLYGGNPSKEVF